MASSNNIKPFLSGIVLTIGLGFFLFAKGCMSHSEITTTTTDTIFVNKPYKEIIIKEVEKPTTVYIYKIDTVYRKKIEQDTLITSVEITPQTAKIHTITPKGLVVIKEYPILHYKQLQLDHQGSLYIKKKRHPKRKRLWRNLGRVGVFVGGVLVGRNL